MKIRAWRLALGGRKPLSGCSKQPNSPGFKSDQTQKSSMRVGKCSNQTKHKKVRQKNEGDENPIEGCAIWQNCRFSIRAWRLALGGRKPISGCSKQPNSPGFKSDQTQKSLMRVGNCSNQTKHKKARQKNEGDENPSLALGDWRAKTSLSSGCSKQPNSPGFKSDQTQKSSMRVGNCQLARVPKIGPHKKTQWSCT